MLPPAQPFEFSATGLLVSGRGLWKGFAVRETAGAVARISFRDGSATGPLLAPCTLNVSESVRDWWSEQGIQHESGLFVVVDAGAVSGAAWTIPENRFAGFSFPSVWAEGAQQMSNSGGQSAATVSGSGAITVPTTGTVPEVVPLLNDSSNYVNINSVRNNGDANNGARMMAVAPMVNRDGASFDYQRTPVVFKVGVASALGATTAWTPAAGKKFRLMRYQVVVTQNAVQAAAGINAIRFLDGGAGFNVGVDAFVPNAAGATLGGFNTGWVDLGNGYLSTAANNVLAINLATALTGGEVFALLVGTEE